MATVLRWMAFPLARFGLGNASPLPAASGGPPPDFAWSLDFSDDRNSMYMAVI